MSIINFGTNYMILGEDAKVIDKLPIATYRVNFSMDSGYSLNKVESDFTIKNTQKVFGNREPKVEMIEKAFLSSDSSIGVLLTGEKGIGKTLFARMVSTNMARQGIPTVIVDGNSIGKVSSLSRYLDTLPSNIMIMFDEYEKVFDKDMQSDMLGLFDGMSNSKRLYVITANDKYKLSNYIKGRPGRFLFDIQFNFLSEQEVEEYVTYFIPDITKNELGFARNLATIYSINYDILNALVRMHKIGYKFADSIESLNLGLSDDYETSRSQKMFDIFWEIKDTNTGEILDSGADKRNRINLLNALSDSDTSYIDVDGINSDLVGYDPNISFKFLQKAGEQFIPVELELNPDLEDEKDNKELLEHIEFSAVFVPSVTNKLDSRFSELNKAYGYDKI